MSEKEDAKFFADGLLHNVAPHIADPYWSSQTRIVASALVKYAARIEELESREVGYIQSLRELEDRVRELDWISVEDRLPEFDKPVLVFLNYNLSKSGIECMTRCPDPLGDFEYLWAYQLNGGPLNNPDTFDDADDFDVTHWMPLPSPPKAE